MPAPTACTALRVILADLRADGRAGVAQDGGGVAAPAAAWPGSARADSRPATTVVDLDCAGTEGPGGAAFRHR